MTEAALQELIKREFPAEMPVTEVADKLDTMQAHPDIEQIRIWFNNVLLDFITLEYLEYSENRGNFLKETSMQLFFRNTEKLPNSTYFQAIAHFFKGQYEKSLRLVRTVMKRDAEEKPYDLQKLVYFYIVPFKNAFPGFWQMVVLQLKQSGAEQLVIEYAELVRDYYFAATEEEKCLLLTGFLQNHSDSVIAHELLGMTYGRMKRWKNQIACLETIEEQPCLFTKACINFQIGWAYGKEKDWNQEEAYYRNCLELEWDYPFANNNLAYSFYRQKRYAEAKELLRRGERFWFTPEEEALITENNRDFQQQPAEEQLFLRYFKIAEDIEEAKPLLASEILDMIAEKQPGFNITKTMIFNFGKLLKRNSVPNKRTMRGTCYYVEEVDG